MSLLKKGLLFFVLNFGGLYIAGLYTRTGASSSWYYELNKAPWTPPSWMFGVAWSVIMICFTFFMVKALSSSTDKKRIYFGFSLQWILNVVWSPLFFYYHLTAVALLVISGLTLLISYGLFFMKNIGNARYFVLPYFLWLLIACSLNGYILFFN